MDVKSQKMKPQHPQHLKYKECGMLQPVMETHRLLNGILEPMEEVIFPQKIVQVYVAL